VVIVAVKAQALPALAPSLAPLLHERTVVLPAINGLPWWYFLPQGVKEQGLRLRSVDPQGGLEKAFPIDNVVAISVFASSSSPEPGVIHHAAGQRLVFGEPAGGDSVRVARLVERFKRAGFAAEQSADVRRDVWNKLLGNACFNPVSLLTLAHTDDMIDDPAVHRLFVRMMDELLALGRRIGIDIAASAADRIATTRKLGHIRTSMLQDLRAGREVEIDAILGAAVECAAAIGAAVPTLDSVLAIAASRARSIGAAG
jgi:2-dehydropantoate 2-reductase